MAAKKKSSAKRKAGRSAMKRGSARKGGKRAAARRGSSRGSAAKKGRSAARRSRSKRPATKPSVGTRSGRQAAVARVKRVTREVMQQATDAMSAGVETLRDLGGNIVDRVRTDSSS
jgi:IS5 family transposase